MFTAHSIYKMYHGIRRALKFQVTLFAREQLLRQKIGIFGYAYVLEIVR